MNGGEPEGPSGPRRYGAAVRSAWLLEPGITYLNHGAFGATPRRVLAAAAAWRERAEMMPARFMETEYPALIRAAAAELAAFVGAEPDRLVFVDNATTGISAVLRGLDLRPGDRVLTTSHVYPAVRNALRFVCDRARARLVEIKLPFPSAGPDQVLEILDRALRPGARFALLDHVTSPTALVLPAQEMVALCRMRRVPVMIDGAHAPGMVPLDLEELGADYYTGNAHKWLFAAKGCGFLHASEAGWAGLKPLVVSHEVGGVGAFDWPGTRDFSPWLSVTEALAFYDELGGAAVREHNRALALEGGRALAEAWGAPAPAPESMIGSMFTVPPPTRGPGTEAAALALHNRLWDSFKIEVPVFAFEGRLMLRISAQVYNQRYHYRCLAEALLEKRGIEP